MGATRTYLYENFENFDKPTEDDFKVLIDFAGEPTSFTNRDVTPSSDILTDLNAETFVLDIRQTYLIAYGSDIYILFGVEGIYGNGGVTITMNHIALVGNASSGTLTQALLVNTTIEGAGVTAGDLFPIGTSYEDIFRALFIDNVLSNIRYEATNTASFLHVGDSTTITKFLWNVSGTPEGLVLSDSDGQYNSTVTGSQVTMNETYVYNAYKKLIWTLSSTNADNISRTTYWVEPSYYGSNVTGVVPTSSEILLGTEVLTLTENGITFPINTIVSQYGWIAVENTQTNGIYTDWEISAFNTSKIGDTEFIKYGGNVTVNSVIYNVYIFTYMSQVVNLKLY